ncbi:Gag-pro-like protein [Cucumis melo var. makuwa]|uniref:Gag-pro-like protein n=1 Tax=Cucumis melo var. makuwa TaxID=1194695 RepID=A0A5D3C619_CUCMM|nr:Gag-pro-like protein [Cucumis melo var. makuwa]
MYCRKMAAYTNNDKLLVHCFQDSLIGPASQWYIQLDNAHIHVWKDLADVFLKQYKHNIDMALDRLDLQQMEKKSSESFKEYTQQWRDMAAQVQPPLIDKEMTSIFMNTLRASFYDRMSGNASTNFSNIIVIGERIEYGIKHGKLAEATTEYGGKEKGTISKKKEGEVHAIGFPNSGNYVSTHTFFETPKPVNSNSPQPFVQGQGSKTNSDTWREKPNVNENPLPNHENPKVNVVDGLVEKCRNEVHEIMMPMEALFEGLFEAGYVSREYLDPDIRYEGLRPYESTAYSNEMIKQHKSKVEVMTTRTMGGGGYSLNQNLETLLKTPSNDGRFGLGYKSSIYDKIRLYEEKKKKCLVKLEMREFDPSIKLIPELYDTFKIVGISYSSHNSDLKDGLLTKMESLSIAAVTQEASFEDNTIYAWPDFELNNWDIIDLPTFSRDFKKLLRMIEEEDKILGPHQELVEVINLGSQEESKKDMSGLNTDIIVHRVLLKPKCNPVRQKLRKMKSNALIKINEEVLKQSEAEFLTVSKYPEWVANIVPVPKKTKKKAIKGSALVDHLAAQPVADYKPIRVDFPDENIFQVEKNATDHETWIMLFDGASNELGHGIGVVLISLE